MGGVECRSEAEEASCPQLPNWRSAVVIENARAGIKSQRTAMLDGRGSSGAGLQRQRTAMAVVLASRTAMLLPDMQLGSEVSHPVEAVPQRWSVMRAASGSKSKVQSMLGWR